MSPAANAAEALESLIGLLVEQIVARLQEHDRAEPGDGEGGGSPWMSVATAAVYLDWPRQRLYKLTAQGAIPHYKHEGRLLFHRGELSHWLAQYAQPGDWINPANRAISH
jgi:excisionase family DNA binding protein